MKISEIISVIEQAAPISTQESYDNSGLIVGSADADTQSALLCVDITESVLDEAIAKGCGLIISHHPIIFHPLKRLNGSNYVERIVMRSISHNIALYACHTNLDQMTGGLSYRLAADLGVINLRVLSSKSQTDNEIGFGVIGELPQPIATEDLLRFIKTKVGTGAIRHSALSGQMVKRVAICTGSGGSLIEQAKNVGADIYISADFRYNDFLDADNSIIIADIGHFESEYCAIDLLYDIITKKITTFALHKSENSANPIHYFV